MTEYVTVEMRGGPELKALHEAVGDDGMYVIMYAELLASGAEMSAGTDDAASWLALFVRMELLDEVDAVLEARDRLARLAAAMESEPIARELLDALLPQSAG